MNNDRMKGQPFILLSPFNENTPYAMKKPPTTTIINEIIYANSHWYATETPVHFHDPVSFLIVPTTAMQGVYSKTKTISARA